MESLTYHFLFNLSLMLALFYVFYIVQDLVKSRYPSIFFYSSALTLSFVFSYHLNDFFIIDMRFVPFLIGSLYHPLSPLLGILAITVRGFHGIDEGFYLNALTFSVISLILWKWRSIFLRFKPLTKIIVTFTATFLFSLGSLLLSQRLIPSEFLVEIWFAALTIPAMSALILTCIIELISYNEENERRLFKEEKLKAIEQMGAAISHDIRNPLTAAIGFTELLSSDSINTESRKHFTSILKTEIEHAEQILQNYLNFTKPATLSFTNVSIDDELFKVVQMLQPLANYHSINIETTLTSQGTINIDRQKFKESATALIQHALLIMEPGGTLIISSYLSGTKLMIRIDIHEVALLGKNYFEKSLNEQNALLSAMHTIKAMKGMIESKNTPIGHTFLLTFKKG